MKNCKTKQKKFRIPNSEFQICNTSGASLLFVLATMFLLLAVGISVLVAAGAGRGAMARQAEHNQLLLLEDSIHRNIMHSLQNPVTISGNTPNIPMEIPLDETLENALGLRERIIRAILETGGSYRNMTLAINFEDDESFDDYVGEMVDRIELIIEPLEEDIVWIRSAEPPSFIESWIPGEDGLPDESAGSTWEVTRHRIPRAATMSFRLIVQVVLTSGDRTVESEVEYIFIANESELTDADPNHLCSHAACSDKCDGIFTDYDDDPLGLVLVGGGGTWEIVRRGAMIDGTNPRLPPEPPPE